MNIDHHDIESAFKLIKVIRTKFKQLAFVMNSTIVTRRVKIKKLLKNEDDKNYIV